MAHPHAGYVARRGPIEIGHVDAAVSFSAHVDIAVHRYLQEDDREVVGVREGAYKAAFAYSVDTDTCMIVLQS